MIPYKSPLPAALPQTLEKRREVIQAIRNLAAREDEPRRERQADIASLRRELKDGWLTGVLRTGNGALC